ncbi:hypothetical protein K6L44_09930 [Gluconacetobacter entanii]|uniref:hypothetical protein n=1 Tax=Gluconacetobacter entanii TaxID=108528 RepID=UPI001C935862|nr:hypothetical protein [Gluconacetobacter entanii]MBY4640298.1 hypothetical protein [Gluconacetobacter entanii]MCW4579928.1 hypothetical protein [Gluconacetobacter entanii]MCW4584641.1 hypothetical protein [Gluconacetobacter entanii]MCW4588097.1 hypothetical protein [Gluconacetobacter entanii]
MSRTSRKVRRIVARVAMRPRRSVRAHMLLDDDLGLDTLDRLEIVVAAQNATGAFVQGENGWQTVGDVIAACRAAVIYGECHHGADT